MATSFKDLGVAFAINVAIVLIFLAAYFYFASKPINGRVYFTKWFVIDPKSAEKKFERLDENGQEVRKPRIASLDASSYASVGTWLMQTLKMPQVEFIQHAGLDAHVFVRLFSLGLKIFVPIGVAGFVVLIPLAVSDNYLQSATGDYGAIDRLSMSNIENNSNRLWAFVALAYIFTFWACRCLMFEYKEIAKLRLDFIADSQKQPDQFTVLVRQVPKAEFWTIEEHVDHFFKINHPDYYLFNQVVYNANKVASLEKKKNRLQNKLDAARIYIEKHPNKPQPSHKTGFCGLLGTRVDSIESWSMQIEKLEDEIHVERKRVLSSPEAIVPASFVTFRKRWGAAVAAQTQQSRNNAAWISAWAPEARDVIWSNLSIPYLQLSGRWLSSMAAVSAMVIFFTIPVTFTQSLANLDSLGQSLPFLKPIIDLPFINSFLQAFLPSLTLKIFLALVPRACMYLAKFEGLVCWSEVERSAMAKYYLVLIVNVFWASVITGSIAKQINAFASNPTSIPTAFGNAIPTKAVFFITFAMLDGWSALALELFRFVPLLLYHFQGLLLVRTPRDRQRAMNVQGIFLAQNISQCLFYFLVAFVYCVITPILIPFVVIFFAVGYIVYRVQLINVYQAQYESAAAFWPKVHSSILSGILVFHVIFIGILIVKEAKYAGPVMFPLPVITYIWHVVFCQIPFENAFKVYALEEAMKKDTIDASHATEDVEYDSRLFLREAYLHPAVKRAMAEEASEEAPEWQKEADGPKLVKIKKSAKSEHSESDDISRASSMSRQSVVTPTKPLLGTQNSFSVRD